MKILKKIKRKYKILTTNKIVNKNYIKKSKIKFVGNNNKIDLGNNKFINLNILIKGNNNMITIKNSNCFKEFRQVKDNIFEKLNILIKGDNQILTINENSVIKNSKIEMDHCKIGIKIGKRAEILDCNIFNNGKLIKIGRNIYLNKKCNLSCRGKIYKPSIEIGKYCIIGFETTIETFDYHPVYDLKTNKLLNKTKDIIIGNHVWLASNVKIKKGAYIPNGCIIAEDSKVLKKLKKENCMYAGIPAVLKKESIRWEKKY